MEAGPRRTSSLALMNAAQSSVPMASMILQEAPRIRTYLMSIRERREPTNIWKKATTTALNALHLLF